MIINKNSYNRKHSQIKPNRNTLENEAMPYKDNDKFHKTYQEGFNPKANNLTKDRNYEYENHKERGHDAMKPPIQKTFHKHDGKKDFSKQNWNKEVEKRQDLERGEEYKKPAFNSQRKLENKNIFAHQLKSIQKTIAQEPVKNKAFAAPYSNTDYKKGTKHESKATAIAGSGIINDLMKTNDDFIITPIGEESKYLATKDSTKANFGSFKDSNSKGSINKGSRDTKFNTGFRTSAASMFVNQTGGSGNFTDYT